MKIRNHRLQLASLAAAVALAMTSAYGQSKDEKPVHPGTPPSELMYKGAPVPIKPGEAPDVVGPKAPPMTAAEFEIANGLPGVG